MIVWPSFFTTQQLRHEVNFNQKCRDPPDYYTFKANKALKTSLSIKGMLVK